MRKAMTYVHYSDNPNLKLTRDFYRSFDGQDGVAIAAVAGFKPHGLWLSTDTEDGWAEWCRREEFGIKPYRYEVTLTPGARLKRIGTYTQLKQFTRRYLASTKDDVLYGFRLYWDRLLDEGYQGILIFPYIYQARLDFNSLWYYPWDCASGCIWDTEAVQKLERSDHVGDDANGTDGENQRTGD
jgi:hypothetical protein